MKTGLLAALLMWGCFSFAQIPALDFEAGNEFSIVGDDPAFWYVTGRANIPVGTTILGLQPFLLPEARVSFRNPLVTTWRVQALLDGETATSFLDCSVGREVRCKVGLRWGY